MRLKKRHKSSRFRGSHTHGRGFKKKARGSGHQGGVGMAGTGKRGDQKKTLVLNLFGNDYFGKDKTLRRGKSKPKLKEINLQYIEDNMASLIKKGIAKESSGVYELNLQGYKVLAKGEAKLKLKISCSACSASALEKVKKNSGSIEIDKKESKENKQAKTKIKKVNSKKV